jgi:hypothetical protein
MIARDEQEGVLTLHLARGKASAIDVEPALTPFSM